MKYRVVLQALAVVEQVQYVEAEDENEAEETALALYNDSLWEYQELQDDTVVVIGVHHDVQPGD